MGRCDQTIESELHDNCGLQNCLIDYVEIERVLKQILNNWHIFDLKCHTMLDKNKYQIIWYFTINYLKSTLEVWFVLQKAMDEIERILIPDGQVIFTEPDIRSTKRFSNNSQSLQIFQNILAFEKEQLHNPFAGSQILNILSNKKWKNCLKVSTYCFLVKCTITIIVWINRNYIIALLLKLIKTI